MDKQLTSKNIIRDLLSDTTFNKSNFNIPFPKSYAFRIYARFKYVGRKSYT